MYKKLAEYYDKLGWAEYSDLTYEIINNILMYNNIIPENFCDLGCGTGELLNMMSQMHDYSKFHGIDLSDDMLSVARSKLKNRKNVRLKQGDIRTFSLEERANVITCIYDTINHLLKKDDWQDTFSRVYDNLKYGGIFIFDMIPTKGYQSYVGTHVKEGNDYTLIRKITYNENTNIIETNINAFIKGNCFNAYKNIKGSEMETTFSFKEVEVMLKKAGFKNIEIYDEDLKRHNMFKSIVEKLPRVFISASK